MAVQGPIAKKKKDDFEFGKIIGEGSYSTVYLAKEIKTGKKYAMKVLHKDHIIREKKTAYVHREKLVFSKLNHPFFITLHFTFQDPTRLYFGLSYAKCGELLDFINKLGCFDEKCTQFYAAEIVLALEYLHDLGIIHRDLKPENILLGEDKHIKITDFGTAKILDSGDNAENSEKQRKNSFVGTAQYVSPEILTSSKVSSSSDLWALGCIIYQLHSGQLPFWGSNEYLIFQKINKLEYEFPDGFNDVAKDLVEKLLVLDPDERLGCDAKGGYSQLKAHPFFKGIDWQNLPNSTAPELLPFLPKKGHDSEDLWGQYEPGLDDQHAARLLGINLAESGDSPKNATVPEKSEKSNKPAPTETTKDNDVPSVQQKLEIQTRENAYHRFVEGNLILKQGLVDKRKGLFARRRMLLLTEGPHLYYVDPQAMVLKGEIPWSADLRTEAKNFKIFFIHTPNRIYYLEDPEGNALKWCKKVDEVWKLYYGNKT